MADPTLAKRVVMVAAVVVLLMTACSGDAAVQAERAVAPTPIPAPSGLGPDGAELTLEVIDGGPATGLVITDYRGFAVYGLTGESITDPLLCVDDCLDVWVPLTPRDNAISANLDASLYQPFTRSEGIEQASYGEIPLYLWTGDNQIGITGGAGVAGTWFALTAVAGFIE